MPPIQHFAAPPGVKSPPLSFAARTGDLLFVSGIPGFDDNGALPDGFEAQFGFVVRNIKRVLEQIPLKPICIRRGRRSLRIGQV
jgi:2-iminobutanoate/2-iminopropanoate deaminase